MTDETSSSHSRRIAEQGVNALLILCRRGNRLAAGFLFIVTLICVTGFLLGYVATDGGTQTLWIVLGGFFGLTAIGMVASALLGLRRIRRNADGLTTEIQALITGDVAAERTVVETVEATEAVEGESALVLSRQFTGFQTYVVRSNREFPALREAMRVVVRFPALIALALVISLVFAVLSPLFFVSLLL